VKENSNGNDTNVGSIENLIWERDYYKLRFEELNKQWNKVIDEILGKDYYNYGCDWESCGKKIKMYELLRTFKREGIENFVTTRKKYIDVILSDYKRVLKENELLRQQNISYKNNINELKKVRNK